MPVVVAECGIIDAQRRRDLFESLRLAHARVQNCREGQGFHSRARLESPSDGSVFFGDFVGSFIVSGFVSHHRGH